MHIRIKKWIENQELKSSSFADKIGVNRATISHVLSSYLVDIWGIGISVKIIFSAYLSVFLIVSFVSLVRNKRSDVRLVCKQESI